VFRRLEYPALKRAVREQQSLFGASVALIDDKASGTQLIQELIADGCPGVTRYRPTTDKIMRLRFVYIPRDGVVARRIPARADRFSPRERTMIRRTRPPNSWTGSSARSRANRGCHRLSRASATAALNRMCFSGEAPRQANAPI
jgi:hypothetical protein